MNATDKAQAMVEAGAKKAAARNKTAATAKSTRKATKPKATAAKRQTTAERFDAEGAKLKKLIDGDMELPAAAKKAGMSLGKAQRLYARISLKPSERVTGTEAEVAKAIVRLRDEEGLAFVPEIWARVEGMSGARIRKLYEATKKAK